MNGLELLENLAGKNQSSEIEGKQLEVVLNKIGFPNAVVTCGIVYLEGHGTLNCPPTSVHEISKMILKQLQNHNLI